MENQEKHEVKEEKGCENVIATITKTIAIIGIIVVVNLTLSKIGNGFETVDTINLVTLTISFLFMYGLGEAIDLLQRIVNNTDNTNKLKKE